MKRANADYRLVSKVFKSKGYNLDVFNQKIVYKYVISKFKLFIFCFIVIIISFFTVFFTIGLYRTVALSFFVTSFFVCFIIAFIFRIKLKKLHCSDCRKQFKFYYVPITQGDEGLVLICDNCNRFLYTFYSR